MTEPRPKLEETLGSLLRVQQFDVATLSRKNDLGQLNFEAAVQPALQLVELFQKIPHEMLKELPDNQLNQIQNPANNVYNLFKQILEFQVAQANPAEVRDNFVRQVRDQYQNVFPNLYPWIAYGVARTVDFNSLAAEGRAAIQSIQDQGGAMQGRLAEYEKTARDLEDKLRASLAEQGVGTQAHYFANEAVKHQTQSDKWGKATWGWAIAVGIVAVASFFTYRVPFLTPQNTIEAIQLVASKVLLFGMLTFMLVRSSRNYLAHKHNEVINRHKENSLLTFNALVEAGATPETRNTVLNHAAASIYSVPDTGYVKGRADGGTSNTALIELLPRLTARINDGTPS